MDFSNVWYSLCYKWNVFGHSFRFATDKQKFYILSSPWLIVGLFFVISIRQKIVKRFCTYFSTKRDQRYFNHGSHVGINKSGSLRWILTSIQPHANSENSGCLDTWLQANNCQEEHCLTQLSIHLDKISYLYLKRLRFNIGSSVLEWKSTLR